MKRIHRTIGDINDRKIALLSMEISGEDIAADPQNYVFKPEPVQNLANAGCSFFFTPPVPAG